MSYDYIMLVLGSVVVIHTLIVMLRVSTLNSIIDLATYTPVADTLKHNTEYDRILTQVIIIYTIKLTVWLPLSIISLLTIIGGWWYAGNNNNEISIAYLIALVLFLTPTLAHLYKTLSTPVDWLNSWTNQLNVAYYLHQVRMMHESIEQSIHEYTQYDGYEDDHDYLILKEAHDRSASLIAVLLNQLKN